MKQSKLDELSIWRVEYTIIIDGRRKESFEPTTREEAEKLKEYFELFCPYLTDVDVVCSLPPNTTITD